MSDWIRNGIKTFGDLYEFLKEDMGNFLLFGHIFHPYENSKDSSWYYTYTQYECNKCFLMVESYRNKIIIFENETGIDIDKNLLLKDKFPTCEKRCNEIIIKKIIE